MEGLEENRKEIGRDGAPPPTARHRRFWRGLGNGVVILFGELVALRISCAPYLEYARNMQQTQPERFVYAVLGCLPHLWLLGVLYIESYLLIRAYCFARAETTERIKLFDYLTTAPVRRQIAKKLYRAVWGLIVLLPLPALYDLLSTLW